MKKSKVVLATLAATVFATSAGALAACGDVPVEEAIGVFSITLDANGGSFSNGESTTTVSTVGGILSAAVETPTYADHTFTGWSLTAGGEIITLGDAGYTFEADVTVYAVWTTSAQPGPGPETPVTYTVTYELNGGTGTAPTQSALEAGETFEVASGEGLSKEDHTFGGWSDGTNVYQAGATYTMPESNVTLTAQWTATGEPEPGPGPETPVTYTVTYELNGGTGTAPTQSALEAGETFEVASGAGLSKENHTFGGWSDGTNVYQAGATYIMPESNVTLTAQWTENGVTPIPTGKAVYKGATKIADLSAGNAEGMAYDYYAENVSLTAGDVITFDLGEGVTVSVVWVNAGSKLNEVGTEVSVTGNKPSVTVSETGTYTVSIQQSTSDSTNGSNKWLVWVGVPNQGGGDDPDHPDNPDNPDNPYTPELNAIYMLGGMNEWKPSDTYKFTSIDTDGGDMTAQYKLQFVTTAANTDVKLWLNDGTENGKWNDIDQLFVCGNEYHKSTETNDFGYNIRLEAVGTYVVYYKVYHETWRRVDIIKAADAADHAVTIGETTLPLDTTNDDITILQYKVGDVHFDANATFGVNVDGAPQNVFIDGASKGIDASVTNIAQATITVTTSGTFTIYVKKFSSGDWGLYTECVADQGGDVGGGDEETEQAGFYVNGTRLNATLLEGTDGAETKPENLVFNYYLENVELHEGDTVKFVLDDVTISKLWAKENTAIQGTTATAGKNITGDTVTISADGTYTISISRYNTQTAAGECSVWIGVPAEEGGGEGEDPVNPTPAGKAVYKGATKIADLIEGTAEGMKYDYYAENVSLTAGDVITFDLGEGVTVSVVWVKADAKLNEKNTEVNVTGNKPSVTVSETGVYTVSIQQSTADFTNGNNKWLVWIGVPAEEGGDQGSTERKTVDENTKGAWLVGKFSANSDTEFLWGEGYQLSFDAAGNDGNGQYVIKIHLNAGDVVKVRTVKENDKHGGYSFISNYDGNVAPGREHTSGDTQDNIVINDTGTYTFYLKTNWNANGLWLVYEADPA